MTRAVGGFAPNERWLAFVVAWGLTLAMGPGLLAGVFGSGTLWCLRAHRRRTSVGAPIPWFSIVAALVSLPAANLVAYTILLENVDVSLGMLERQYLPTATLIALVLETLLVSLLVPEVRAWTLAALEPYASAVGSRLSMGQALVACVVLIVLVAALELGPGLARWGTDTWKTHWAYLMLLWALDTKPTEEQIAALPRMSRVRLRPASAEAFSRVAIAVDGVRLDTAPEVEIWLNQWPGGRGAFKSTVVAKWGEDALPLNRRWPWPPMAEAPGGVAERGRRISFELVGAVRNQLEQMGRLLGDVGPAERQKRNALRRRQSGPGVAFWATSQAQFSRLWTLATALYDRWGARARLGLTVRTHAGLMRTEIGLGETACGPFDGIDALHCALPMLELREAGLHVGLLREHNLCACSDPARPEAPTEPQAPKPGKTAQHERARVLREKFHLVSSLGYRQPSPLTRLVSPKGHETLAPLRPVRGPEELDALLAMVDPARGLPLCTAALVQMNGSSSVTIGQLVGALERLFADVELRRLETSVPRPCTEAAWRPWMRAAQSQLAVSPLFSVVGQPVRITFSLRQSDWEHMRTTVEDNQIVHRVDVLMLGEGARPTVEEDPVWLDLDDEVVPERVGTYDGSVEVNGCEVLRYTLRVHANEAAAALARQRTWDRLDTWEKGQAKR